jgi:hypothetical protein
MKRGSIIFLSFNNSKYCQHLIVTILGIIPYNPEAYKAPLQNLYKYKLLITQMKNKHLDPTTLKGTNGITFEEHGSCSF